MDYGNATGALQPADGPKREAEIPRELARLKSTVQDLTAHVEALLKRAEPVLRAEPTQPAENGKVESVPMTQLGNIICSFRNELRSLDQRVRSVLDRAEI